MKNNLKDFNVLYQNVRGLKLKISALDEPSFICLVETHLPKEEQIEIPGCNIYKMMLRGIGKGYW